MSFPRTPNPKPLTTRLSAEELGVIFRSRMFKVAFIKPCVSWRELRWRSVTDHTKGKYYFDSVINPSVFWVDMENIDFTGGVQRLPWPEEDLAGDVSKKFAPSEPFPFIHPVARQLHV